MSTSQNNIHHIQADEISLQELFMALWRYKILIIAATLIVGIATGIVSVFFITPVYHARLNIIISMPETQHTKYGDYTLPISSNEQYINLITSNDILMNTISDMGYDPGEVSVETLRERISVIQTGSKDSVQNSFNINVASDDPEDARRLAATLYKNYIEFLDMMVASGATTYFINYYNIQLSSLQVQLDSNRELLEKNLVLLSNTPMTIDYRDSMDGIISSDNTVDYIVVGDIINPNYTELELDIIEIKQQINSVENTMIQYDLYLEELEASQLEIEKYYESGELSELETGIVRITKSNVYLPSEPVAPSNKTSPSNVRNAIIGSLLGGVVSVLIALAREYWFTKGSQ